MSAKPEEKVIFSLAPASDGGPPVLLLLMTEASWNYMRNGMSHEFDLTKIGIPVRLTLTGTKSHASAMDMIHKISAAIDIKDLRDVDLAFDQKPQQQ
jgi:hypothetical protein